MEAIVLYPSPGMGHLISMVEVGKLLLTHHPSFTIIILITTPPFNAGSTASYIAAVSATTTSISFHQLPIISLDPAAYDSVEALMRDLIHLNNVHADASLTAISLTSTVHSLIIDLFCYPALEIAAKLNIPAYYFFTSGASCLALYLHMPSIHRNTTENFKNLNTLFHLPCLPPIPLNHLPEPMLIRDTTVYDFLINCTTHLAKSAGIIINTFETLEPKAVKALSKGFSIPDGPNQTPPVFCIGPLIDTNKGRSKGNGDDDDDKGIECLKWLDSQPSQSVVFLCFGSMGLFSKKQLMEIAVGLEKSGQRFLWVVRNPPSINKNQGFTAGPDPALDSLLPEGFLDRTSDRGLVVKAWAPQVEVLNHDSVGGFLTHCGWNSVLESICAGVPMVAWPLYAEQKFNKILLVEELKLAMPVNESESGFVSAEEVEKRVRELMESKEGNSLRNRTMAKRKEAVAALREGGPSRAALAQLLKCWA
ncbi:PREDICTED: UDP-glycosyltransferase 88A1 [Theobroma cacao]|uniref:Glycosyltransferase n=1 Tax=Theobroma cacao TaxID=3641 RepID=A0AB32VF28_THECC|nr:PREDICTED: UDP-glycosyltransferase 88A1 [Theobroma cacao]